MKATRCGKCGRVMREEWQSLFGERVRVDVCSCGKELVSVRDLARLQSKLMPRVSEVRSVTTAGSSTAVTIPKQLTKFFKKGDRVSIDFDPRRMELRIRRFDELKRAGRVE